MNTCGKSYADWCRMTRWQIEDYLLRYREVVERKKHKANQGWQGALSVLLQHFIGV